VADAAADVIVELWDTFVGEDATLVEVNPAGPGPEGQRDRVGRQGHPGRETPAFRHPGHAALVDKRAEDPLEAKAKAKDLNYVKLDGQVGIIGQRARGLVMVHPGRGRLRRGAAQRGQAGQLPGHRRRRLGGGDGRPGLGRHPG